MTLWMDCCRLHGDCGLSSCSLAAFWHLHVRMALNDVLVIQAYDALNFLGSTPWRINQQALAVLLMAWENGGNVAGLIPREAARPPSRPHTELALKHNRFNLVTNASPTHRPLPMDTGHIASTDCLHLHA